MPNVVGRVKLGEWFDQTVGSSGREAPSIYQGLDIFSRILGFRWRALASPPRAP